GMETTPIQPRVLNITALTLFGIICLVPVSHMLVKSLSHEGGFTLQHYISVFGDSRTLVLLGRSMGIAVGATILAVVLGVVQAFLIQRTNLKGRRVWRKFYLLPLCIPPHVHAIAWIYLLGDAGTINKLLQPLTAANTPMVNIYSAAWVAVILALAYHPLVTLITGSGLASMDRRMEEAASQYHRLPTVIQKIILPLLLPHIMAAAVLVFIFSFFNYGVASLLRVHTYPVEIFAQFSAFYNEAAATALAVPVILTALALLAVQRYWMGNRSYVVMDTGNTATKLMPLDKFQPTAILFTAGLCLTSVVLPVFMLIFQSRSVAAYQTVWKNASQEICFTILLSLAAATFITALCFVLGGISPHVKSKYRIQLDILFFAPLAIPATVLGIGMIYVWNRPATQFIYGSAGILIIAYAARFIPFALRAVTAGFHQIGPSLREAGQLYEGRWYKRAMKIDIPLSLPSITAGWALVFIFCMSELAATLLVIPPGMGTVSLKLYTLMHYGANQMVAALSLVLIGINLTVAALAVFGAHHFMKPNMKYKKITL
ncbi:MAG: iron ABC transporter permease, partial [Desulfobacteraceae bacterium]|nr:iron ABC transporter permease [Desulfobacteraceae bacterium]